MGALMDEIVFTLGDGAVPSREDFAAELGLIAEACRWTDGSWELAPGESTAWNQLQNTPRDILSLTDHLLDLYRDAKEGAPVASAA
jgi:hypothetical protein